MSTIVQYVWNHFVGHQRKYFVTYVMAILATRLILYVLFYVMKYLLLHFQQLLFITLL